MMDLFEAIRFDKAENRYTALFVAVFERLTPEQRVELLPGLPLKEVTRALTVQLQRRGEDSVPDAVLLWPGELIVAVEVKLGPGEWGAQLRRHAEHVAACAAGKAARQRWLLSLTTDGARCRSDVIGEAAIQRQGVNLFRLSWQDLADQGVLLAERMQHISHQLRRGILLAFADRLYKEGLAVRPLDPVNLGIAADLIPQLRQLRLLRRHAERWLAQVQAYLPDAKNWKAKTRWDDWCEVSITTTYSLALRQAEDSSPTTWFERPEKSTHWWIEICGPARSELVGETWPPGPDGGLALRVGFVMRDTKSVDAGLLALRTAFEGCPFPPRTFERVWSDPRGRFGEIFCYHPFNPAEAAAAGKWLIQTMATQWEAVEDLFEKVDAKNSPLDDWNGISAHAAMELLVIQLGECALDPVVTSAPGEDPPLVDGVGDQVARAPVRSHSGALVDCVWTSRSGSRWTTRHWSCCGAKEGSAECLRTPDAHHPGDLQGTGNPTTSGGTWAHWTCCRKAATEPGCTAGDPPAVVEDA